MNEQEYKIKGWVARDEDSDVSFHVKHPYRESIFRLTDEKNGVWFSRKERFRLSALDKMFPELTWEDEPIEVELTIKKI